jgi:hypothetical protein
MDSLWLDQVRYLQGIDPALATAFPPINRNPLYLKMNYIRLRLNNDPSVSQAYNDLCRNGLRANSKMDAFWRLSDKLPRPLFQKAVDLLLTQSVWKQMVTRALRGKQPSPAVQYPLQGYSLPPMWPNNLSESSRAL